MEIILDHEEVEALLREALAARGATIPPTCQMRLRLNNKKSTFRVVFSDRALISSNPPTRT